MKAKLKKIILTFVFIVTLYMLWYIWPEKNYNKNTDPPRKIISFVMDEKKLNDFTNKIEAIKYRIPVATLTNLFGKPDVDRFLYTKMGRHRCVGRSILYYVKRLDIDLNNQNDLYVAFRFDTNNSLVYIHSEFKDVPSRPIRPKVNRQLTKNIEK